MFKKRKGFTLLEIIVATGIFALVIGSVVWIIIGASRNNQIVWRQLERQNDGRKVLQKVVDAVRRAEQSSIGSYAVESAGANQLVFYSNMDSDGYIERVRFFLTSTTLKIGIIKPTGSPLTYASSSEQIVELAHNVTNLAEGQPVFTYFNADYTGSEAALTQPVTASDVRLVRVYLKLEDDPSKIPVALSVETTVQIRGLKDN